MEQRRLSLIALVATGALLAGCSGSGGAASNDEGTSPGSNASSTTQTFAFGSALGPVESIHVEFPKPLLESMGSDADNLLVTSLDLKAHALDSAKYCAVDVTRTFAKGAAEALSTPEKVDYQSMSILDLWASSDEAGQRLDALAKASGAPTGVKELASEAGFVFTMSADPERDARLRDIGLEGFDVDAFNAGVQKLKDELSASTPDTDPTTTLMERENAKPLSELKEDSPEPGNYMNDDATVVTHVMKCALEPFADSTSETGVEKLGITKDGSPEDFAYVRFTVMKDGKITITDSKIYGYQQDSSGNWLQK